MHYLSPTNKITLIAWLPIWLSACIVLADYFFLERIKFESPAEHIKKLTLVKGNNACKLTLYVPSKYESPIYNTKIVGNDICENIGAKQPLTIHQSLILHRWILITSNNENYYYEDNDSRLDLMYIIASFILPLAFSIKKSEPTKAPKSLFTLLFISFLYYTYEILV